MDRPVLEIAFLQLATYVASGTKVYFFKVQIKKENSINAAQDMCTVQLMWQPLTEISYPTITLLASFKVRSSTYIMTGPFTCTCSYHLLYPATV